MQMGSNMKKTIIEEQTANALMKWRNNAREKTKHREAGFDGLTSSTTTPGRGMSPNASPVHLLNKFKERSEDPQSARTSPRRGQQELGDMYPVVEQQHLPNSLDRRAASSNSISIDIADSDFSFSPQR
jgi:mlo protein